MDMEANGQHERVNPACHQVNINENHSNKLEKINE